MKKFIFCAGVLFCAPLLSFAAVDFTAAAINKQLQISVCQEAALLDKIERECK
jgi:hypothetical protein